VALNMCVTDILEHGTSPTREGCFAMASAQNMFSVECVDVLPLELSNIDARDGDADAGGEGTRSCWLALDDVIALFAIFLVGCLDWLLTTPPQFKS
jgi:hypothetical protein